MSYLTDFIIDLGLIFFITVHMPTVDRLYSLGPTLWLMTICPMIQSDELSIPKLDAWDQ